MQHARAPRVRNRFGPAGALVPTLPPNPCGQRIPQSDVSESKILKIRNLKWLVGAAAIVLTGCGGVGDGDGESNPPQGGADPTTLTAALRGSPETAGSA